MSEQAPEESNLEIEQSPDELAVPRRLRRLIGGVLPSRRRGFGLEDPPSSRHPGAMGPHWD